MSTSKILVEAEGPVTTIIINRPQAKNALDNEVLTLIGALEYRDLSGTTAAQIVCEEAEACFSGARSFGETAELVQNRVGLWLSEQFS